MNLVLVGASCEALGHPAECTEPAPGTVEQSSSHSLSINGTQVATIASADMNFPSHSHDYSIENGCHDNQSHTLDPETSAASLSLTVNGSPIYVVADSATTDPGSGGNVNIVDSGGNNTVSETP